MRPSWLKGILFLLLALCVLTIFYFLWVQGYLGKPLQRASESYIRGSEIPLMDAIARHDNKRVQTLVDAGANINQKDKYTNTPLVMAVSLNNVYALKLLLKHGAQSDVLSSSGNPPIVMAASVGNTESVRLLLENGVKVDGRGNNSNGPTALIAAVGNSVQISKGYPGAGKPVEFIELIQLLLAHKPNIHAKTLNGKTALSIAKERKMNRTIKLLQQAGAKY